MKKRIIPTFLLLAGTSVLLAGCAFTIDKGNSIEETAESKEQSETPTLVDITPLSEDERPINEISFRYYMERILDAHVDLFGGVQEAKYLERTLNESAWPELWRFHYVVDDYVRDAPTTEIYLETEELLRAYLKEMQKFSKELPKEVKEADEAMTQLNAHYLAVRNSFHEKQKQLQLELSTEEQESEVSKEDEETSSDENLKEVINDGSIKFVPQEDKQRATREERKRSTKDTGRDAEREAKEEERAARNMQRELEKQTRNKEREKENDQREAERAQEDSDSEVAKQRKFDAENEIVLLEQRQEAKFHAEYANQEESRAEKKWKKYRDAIIESDTLIGTMVSVFHTDGYTTSELEDIRDEIVKLNESLQEFSNEAPTVEGYEKMDVAMREYIKNRQSFAGKALQAVTSANAESLFEGTNRYKPLSGHSFNSLIQATRAENPSSLTDDGQLYVEGLLKKVYREADII